MGSREDPLPGCAGAGIDCGGAGLGAWVPSPWSAPLRTLATKKKWLKHKHKLWSGNTVMLAMECLDSIRWIQEKCVGNVKFGRHMWEKVEGMRQEV